MGMPVSICIVGGRSVERAIEAVYDLFEAVDARFSVYKPTSEVSRINDGLPKRAWSDEMRTVLALCERTKRETNGYFDVYYQGKLDPSGLVKGWAIRRAAQLLEARGHRNFYLDAGGDIEARGHNVGGEPWRVGIRNPFNRDEIIKVLALSDKGVATSGAYIRGDHIYNPLVPGAVPRSIASVTVIGPDAYDADRFATAAYVMGMKGPGFVESRPGLEAYVVGQDGMATMTSNFKDYVA